jgi:hypothetical protein
MHAVVVRRIDDQVSQIVRSVHDNVTMYNLLLKRSLHRDTLLRRFLCL